MRKLFFDIVITGHHSEYLKHLVDFLHESKSNNNQYFFVVHPEFSVKFRDIYDKAKEIENLVWIPVSKSEYAYAMENDSMFKKSIRSYKLMNAYAKKNKVDHVCCLSFHALKYATIFHRPIYTISSIQFLQFYRLPKNKIEEKWTYYKRYYLTKLSITNKKIKCVFVLNDNETVNFLNTTFKTDIFNVLPDPIYKCKPIEGFDLFKNYDIDPSKETFLHIGSLGSRKGTIETIESVLHLTEINQKKITLLIVGKASSKTEETAIQKAIKNSISNTKTDIIWENQFVSNAMMSSIFDQCYSVIIPYKNAEYSSGILGHAAAAKKLVIATGSGLIKNIVEKYKLGLLLDKPDAISIAAKIEEAIEIKHKVNIDNDFIKHYDPMVFAEKVINS